MPATNEHPLQALAQWLPPGSFEEVVAYLEKYKVHLTISKERNSILGDYRNAVHGKNHRITVNSNLNKYAFLITLLHELAHLLAFEQYSNRIAPHGREWKNIYASLLAFFLHKEIFPADIATCLVQSLNNPAASSCSETALTRVLVKYDERSAGHYLVEELEQGASFKLKDGRIFKKEEKLRKRYRCTEIKTGKQYLFSPVYEVVKC